MTRAPAFMFYAADFKTNTAELTHRERGVYIDLLCHAWINDGLPVDESRLFRLIGDADAPTLWDAIRHMWEMTEPDHPFGVRWINPRQEKEREKQQKRKQSGSKGGSKTQAKRQANGQAKRQANGQAKPKLSFESEKETETEDEAVREQPLPAARAGDLGDTLRALEEIWPVERCRPTDSGQRERELFQKHRTGGLPETVIDDAREYLAAHGFGDGHVSGCPNLHRWINEARWIDPLPVKAGRPAPAPIDNTPLTADELREYEQIMAGGDAT